MTSILKFNSELPQINNSDAEFLN